LSFFRAPALRASIFFFLPFFHASGEFGRDFLSRAHARDFSRTHFARASCDKKKSRDPRKGAEILALRVFENFFATRTRESRVRAVVHK
jgi:hypothetical protein